MMNSLLRNILRCWATKRGELSRKLMRRRMRKFTTHYQKQSKRILSHLRLVWDAEGLRSRLRKARLRDNLGQRLISRTCTEVRDKTTQSYFPRVRVAYSFPYAQNPKRPLRKSTKDSPM